MFKHTHSLLYYNVSNFLLNLRAQFLCTRADITERCLGSRTLTLKVQSYAMCERGCPLLALTHYLYLLFFPTYRGEMHANISLGIFFLCLYKCFFLYLRFRLRDGITFIIFVRTHREILATQWFI